MLAFYICLCVMFISIGYFWAKQKLANPLSIFNAIWLIIVLLYQLHLSRLQEPLSDETMSVLCINVAAFSIGYLVLSLIIRLLRKNKRSTLLAQEKNKKVKSVSVSSKLIKKMFFWWAAVEIVEVFVSGGIPVFWKIFGDTKTYMSFGVPTLHGLMNAFGLVIITVAFYEYLQRKKKKEKLQLMGIILTMLVYYLLLITRQVVISAIIQMGVVYFILRGKEIKGKSWVKILFYSFIGIIAFGLIGNFRTGYEAFLSVSLIESQLPSLLVGFYWVYMYLTMTLANVNNAVALGVTGFGGLKGALNHFLPSVFENQMTSGVEVPPYLVTEAYNVSGYFISFYTGMGDAGVILIATVYGILGAIIYEAFRKIRSERNTILYAVYIQIIALSFFANHLLYLPSGFQLIIVLALFFVLKRKGATRD